jgi:hypothetical protein
MHQRELVTGALTRRLAGREARRQQRPGGERLEQDPQDQAALEGKEAGRTTFRHWGHPCNNMGDLCEGSSAQQPSQAQGRGGGGYRIV